MARTNLGELVVSVRTNTAKFTSGLSTAGKNLDNFRKKTQGAQRALTVFSTVGVAALTAIVRQTAKSIDATTKFADRIGVSTEALTGLSFAAKLTGVGVSQLNLGLQRMTRRVSEAAQGTGEAKNALKELGLDAQRLTQLSPDKQFQEIAEAMANVSNQSDRVRLAMKLFDSEGVALVNTLRLGKQGLMDVAKEAEDLGIAFSRVDAAKIEQANDAFTRAQELTKGFAQVLTIELAPVLTAVTNALVESGKEAGGFGEIVRSAMDKAAKVVGVFANGLHGIKVIFKILKVAVAEFVDFTAGNFIRLINILTRLGETALKKLGFNFQGLEKVNQTLANITDQLDLTTAKLREELQAALLQEIPSTGIERALERARVKAQETAEEIAKSVEAASQAQVGPIRQTFEPVKLLDIPQDDIDKLNRAKQILENAKTPAENFADELSEIQMLFDQGFFGQGDLGQRNFEKALQNIGDNYIQLAEQTRGINEQMAEQAKQAARNIQNAFRDFFFDPFNEGLEGLVVGFLNAIREMAANQAALQFTELLNIGGNSGGFLGGALNFLGFGGGGSAANFAGASTDLDSLIGLSGLFAEGGRPPVGRPAIVGDGGEPELFIPDVAGTVVPFSQLGANANMVTINQNIAAPQPEKFHLSASRGAFEARRVLNR